MENNALTIQKENGFKTTQNRMAVLDVFFCIQTKHDHCLIYQICWVKNTIDLVFLSVCNFFRKRGIGKMH